MGKFRNHLSPPVMCHHDPIRLLIISGNFGFKMILRFAFDHVQLYKASTTILGPSFNSINQSRRKMFAREISFSWKTAATVFLSLLEAIILASLLGHNSSRCNQSRALLFAQPTLMRSSGKMHLLITQKKRIKMKSFFVYSFARSDHKKKTSDENKARASLNNSNPRKSSFMASPYDDRMFWVINFASQWHHLHLRLAQSCQCKKWLIWCTLAPAEPRVFFCSCAILRWIRRKWNVNFDDSYFSYNFLFFLCLIVIILLSCFSFHVLHAFPHTSAQQ